jgi:hypothetical protein
MRWLFFVFPCDDEINAGHGRAWDDDDAWGWIGWAFVGILIVMNECGVICTGSGFLFLPFLSCLSWLGVMMVVV